MKIKLPAQRRRSFCRVAGAFLFSRKNLVALMRQNIFVYLRLQSPRGYAPVQRTSLLTALYVGHSEVALAQP
jgi:hypothetical protein